MRVLSDCRNTILGSEENVPHCLKGFQENFGPIIITNIFDRFRNSLNVRNYCKTIRSGISLRRITIKANL